jgi:hypothetical protein
LLYLDDYVLLVAESNEQLIGFIIGRVVTAPAVYNPGGLTLMIDDFCVSAPRWWNTAGEKLVSELKRFVNNKNIAQILIVCGAHDITKREFLKRIGLTIASEWYVGELKK